MGGAAAGTEYDQLAVLGAIDLGTASRLNVSLTGGFVPQTGDQFAIVTSASISGTFAGLPQGAIFLGPNAIPFQIFYSGTFLNPDAVVLVVAPAVFIDNVVVAEPLGPAVFTVSLSGASSIPVVVTFTTVVGGGPFPATAFVDYLPQSGALTFTPGETRQTIAVPIINDFLDEENETFLVLLDPLGLQSAVVGDNVGLGTIVDEDPPPNVSVSSEARLEGDQGTTVMRFTVSLSVPSGKPISVSLSTQSFGPAGSPIAQAGSDYVQAFNQLIAFAPGVTVQFFDVAIIGDRIPELDEFFSVVFGPGLPINAGFLTPGLGRIDNDDAFLVTGADAGGGPHVKVFHRRADGLIDASPVHSFFAYDARFTGGVRVALGDVNRDGTPDIITGAGPGGGPHVRVFDGVDPRIELLSFMAYNPLFGGGVFVAAGDITGDGRAEVVTGADAGGGPHVRSFDGATGGELPGPIGSFFAYKAGMNAGVRVAVGDVNGDGRADVITGTGPGYENPLDRGGFNRRNERQVLVFSAVGTFWLSAFDPFPGEPRYRGGVHLAFMDTGVGNRGRIIVSKANGDGRVDAAFAQAHINGLDFSTISVAALVRNPDNTEVISRVNRPLTPYPGFQGSVRIAVVDALFSNSAALITAPGPGGGPHVKGFPTELLAPPDNLRVLDQVFDFFAYDPLFGGGVWVAG